MLSYYTSFHVLLINECLVTYLNILLDFLHCLRKINQFINQKFYLRVSKTLLILTRHHQNYCIFYNFN